jgi:cell division protein FtsL
MASFAPATARAYAPAKPRRAPAKAPAPARRAAQPRRAGKAQARPRVAGGVLWIVIVAVLLAGIVAVNVAALRLNMQVEQLDNQHDELVSKNEGLQSQISTAAAAGRVQQLGKALGLGSPAETTYLRLKPNGR